MIIVYDYRLIILSVMVAILAAHGGMLLLARRSAEPFSYKTKLVVGALIIGGGIWTMHFIGMLALHMSLQANYAVLPTLISALIAVLLTGLSLYCATSGHLPKLGLFLGAILMGGGIAGMHYSGMEALRSVCTFSYTPRGVVLSIIIGVGASWMALRCMQLKFRNLFKSLAAAVALGLAISAMHYVAMLNTQFESLDNALALQNPVLNTTFLACIVAVATFFIVNSFLLIVLPSEEIAELSSIDGVAPVDAVAAGTTKDAPNTYRSIRISGNGETRFVDIKDILFVSADGHYTQIGYLENSDRFTQQICDRSLSVLSEILVDHGISQCHRSHLVNLQYIYAIRRNGDRAFVTFGFKGSPEIPISRSKLPEFSKKLVEVQNAI